MDFQAFFNKKLSFSYEKKERFFKLSKQKSFQSNQSSMFDTHVLYQWWVKYQKLFWYFVNPPLVCLYTWWQQTSSSAELTHLASFRGLWSFREHFSCSDDQRIIVVSLEGQGTTEHLSFGVHLSNMRKKRDQTKFSLDLLKANNKARTIIPCTL